MLFYLLQTLNTALSEAAKLTSLFSNGGNGNVFRDGKWIEEDASVLVPGDIISVKLGDIIPADARLLDGDPLKIDQSELTAVVIATGVHTFFDKAAHLVDSTNQQGHFQKVLTAIGNFCICSIAVRMITEIIVMYSIQHREYRPGIDNLLAAGIDIPSFTEFPTWKIALEDLVKHFDLPIVESSRNLNVGLTVMKRKCREFGIPRWPHRKIKSLDGLICDLQEEVDQRQQEDEAAAYAVAKRRMMLETETESIEKEPCTELKSEMKRFRQDIFKRRHKARALKN
ncbi:hypothetical protein F3Y22_tig00110159pilonHSYRG00125 [Hibiscus syriacus]|uniref:RWP-RK domain-containing protein n=1 Tax=Hibiscus syriacus TaxID=106335 RepID=A0A6A3BI45_HIBSY|nr:hypothetical protein F3Y22_tig00110159pilonHSYRG00125 [Hibiscus syriacus]